MRKDFWGLSFLGGALLVSSLLLGLTLRVVGLTEVSAWSDEIAGWFYSQNIPDIIKYESHTPVYYLLSRAWYFFFPHTVVSLRVFSLVMSFSLLLLSTFLLVKKRGWNPGLLLVILWSLWPTLVIHDRQGRHYALFLELTILLLILWRDYRKEMRPLPFWGLLVFYQFIHPMGMIPVFFLLCWDFLFHKRDFRSTLFKATSVLPLLFYYGYRFYQQGRELVLINISWISNDSWAFLKAWALLFAGDSYPFSLFYPISYGAYAFLMITISVIIIYFSRGSILKQESFRQFFFLLPFTIAVVELVAFFGMNLRMGRYYIYIVAFFLVAVIDLCSHWQTNFRKKCVLVFLVLVTYNFSFLRPWSYYEWDDQNVERFKREYPTYGTDENLVICANSFQLKYYFNRPYVLCEDEIIRRVSIGENFRFFDLNGSYKSMVIYLMQNGKIENYTSYRRAKFLNFKKTGKHEK